MKDIKQAAIANETALRQLQSKPAMEQLAQAPALLLQIAILQRHIVEKLEVMSDDSTKE